MDVTLFITIAIALIGWVLAFIQMYKNRQWQKKDLLANRRYDAYNRFMVQLDSRLDALAEEIRVAGAAKSKLKELYKRNRAESKTALREMMERLAQLEKEINDLYPIPQRIKIDSRIDG